MWLAHPSKVELSNEQLNNLNKYKYQNHNQNSQVFETAFSKC